MGGTDGPGGPPKSYKTLSFLGPYKNARKYMGLPVVFFKPIL